MQVWCTYLFQRQNEHWRSIAEYCAPCSIGYNVILHFEKLKVTNNTENFGNRHLQYFPDDTFDKLCWKKKVKTQQKLWNVEGWGAPACWKWSPQDGRDAEATVEEHQQWRNSDFTDCSQVSMIWWVQRLFFDVAFSDISASWTTPLWRHCIKCTGIESSVQTNHF